MSAGRRVLLSGIPRILRDLLVHRFSLRPDIHVVDSPEAGTLAGEVAATDATTLVIAEQALGGVSATELLNRLPGLHVVVLLSEARDVYWYELQPVRRELHGISLDELVELVCVGTLPAASASNPHPI